MEDLSIPVELPCGCLETEDNIIAFLQKICYCCSKPNRGECYQMKNHATIMKECFDRVNWISFPASSHTRAIEQLNELLLYCGACYTPITKIGNQIDDFVLC